MDKDDIIMANEDGTTLTIKFRNKDQGESKENENETNRQQEKEEEKERAKVDDSTIELEKSNLINECGGKHYLSYYYVMSRIRQGFILLMITIVFYYLSIMETTNKSNLIFIASNEQRYINAMSKFLINF